MSNSAPAIVGANLSWDLAQKPLPPVPLRNKVIDHVLLEVLELDDEGMNHTILRLVFKHKSEKASERGPANTRGIRMSLEVKGKIPDPVTRHMEGALIAKTFTFEGRHQWAVVSKRINTNGKKCFRDFINVAQRANLTPCDFINGNGESTGCRDFISQFIYHLHQARVIDIPAGDVSEIYDTFRWKYFTDDGEHTPPGKKTLTPMDLAAFNSNYQHVNIANCTYASDGANATAQ